MKFLPFEKISYKTNLKEALIIGRLQYLTGHQPIASGGSFPTGISNRYQGTVKDNTFTLSRIIGYRNSFLPVIKGAVEQDFDGTHIRLTMRLNIFVMIFVCVWIVGVGTSCIIAAGKGNSGPQAFIPFAMLIFLYALTMGAFKFESAKAKKDMLTLFEGARINNIQ